MEDNNPTKPIRFNIEAIKIPYTNNTDKEVLIIATIMSEREDVATWSVTYQNLNDDKAMDDIHEYLNMEFGNIVMDLTYLKPTENISVDFANSEIMSTLKAIFESINNTKSDDYPDVDNFEDDGEEGGDSYAS